MEKTKLINQINQIFPKKLSIDSLNDFFESLKNHGYTSHRQYNTVMKMGNMFILDSSAERVIFDDENLEHKFNKFKEKLKQLLRFLEYSREDNQKWNSNYPIKPDMFYIFREGKFIELEKNQNEKKVKIKYQIPWEKKNHHNFVGTWSYFFESNFKPFIETVIDAFDSFRKELNNKMISLEDAEIDKNRFLTRIKTIEKDNLFYFKLNDGELIPLNGKYRVYKLLKKFKVTDQLIDKKIFFDERSRNKFDGAKTATNKILKKYNLKIISDKKDGKTYYKITIL